MTISIYPNPVQADASALVVFRGKPSRKLVWELVGVGELKEADLSTDKRGIAKAVFFPAAADQTVTVRITYVP